MCCLFMESAALQDLEELRQSLAMEQVELLTVPQTNGDAEGFPTSSRPPSPPESGTATPRVSIGPCPPRLTPLYPPINYGCVDEDKIYRSSYPQDRNVEFIDSLGFRSILTLVDTEAPLGFQSWLDECRLRHAKIQIGTNKEKSGRVDADLTAICQALIFLMDSSNHPVYVHCNQGKHRTGCVIGCLRRIQGWPISEIIKEYEIYAGVKSRPGDVALIKVFDPTMVYNLAVSDGIVDTLSRSGHGGVKMVRSDSTIANIYALRAALEAGLMGEMDWDTDGSSSVSDGPVSPPSGNAIDTPSDRVVDEEPKTVEYIMDPKIVTRNVDEIEEGTMTDGIEAGC